MESEDREKSIVPTGSGRKPIRGYEDSIEIISTPTAGADFGEIDPYAYLQVIWKHRKVSSIFFLIVVLTALFVSFLTKPMYKATATVEVALEKPRIVEFPEVVEADTSGSEFYNTQAELIKSRSMAEAVLSRYNLWDNPDFNISQPNFNPIPVLISFVDEAVNSIKTIFTGYEGEKSSAEHKANGEKARRDGKIEQFRSRVNVSSSDTSRIITIEFKAYSPVFAAKMADSIAETFVNWTLDRKLEATRNAREFLQRQLAEVKGDLEKSEEALHKFSVDNNIVSLDASQNLIYHQLEKLNDSLAQTAAERTAKESLYKSVESGNPNEILEVINDPIIQNLKSQYNNLLVDYSNLSASFKPEYPPLKQLQAKIDEVRARLNEETKKRVEAIKADYEIAAQKEEGLKKRAQEQEKLAMSLNEKTIQYKALEREVQSNKSIYESLLQRFKETDIAGGIRAGNIQVVDHAAIPTSPFIPNIPRNLLLAILVGLVGGVGIAFVLEYLDRTVKTPEEIREKMRLPVLGTVLKLTESKGYRRLRNPIEKLYMLEPRSPFSESIRTLRASIVLSSQDHPVRSILVTSCWPGEGKTTIATNLAISFAYGTNRVLLVEADLRHPTLSKTFGISKSSLGLSNYLMFGSEVSEIIHSTDIPQLFVLPSGSINPPNPSELLQSEEMKKLLSKLRSEFDYLIIDSSPAIGLADSLVLSTIADATVLVAGVGMTMRRDISHIVKQLSDVGAQFLGVIINGLEAGQDHHYYRYDQYYNRDRTQDRRIEVGIGDYHRREEFDERGELKNTPYPNLLISLQKRKKTGILDIDSHLKFRIYFLEGFPVFVEGGDSKMLLGNIVFSEGRIKQEDYQKALNNLAQTKKKIGEVMVEMGFISPHELDWLLEYQIKEKLIRGFECTTGTYAFKAVGDFVKDMLVYKINTLQVIYEGIKRFGDSRKIEKKFFTIKELALLSGLNLGERLSKVKRLIEIKEAQKEPFDLDGLIINVEPEFAEKLRDVGFSPTEFRFLRSLKESGELEDILSNNRLSREDALKLIYFLNLSGFLEIKIKEPESDYRHYSRFSAEGLSRES